MDPLDRQKHQKVLEFIKKWQINNPYNDNQEAYNVKFKEDFNNYIESSNLSKEDKEYYFIN